MKPTAAFKLNSQAKTFLANIDDKHTRGAVKKLMIQAQLAEQHQPKRDRVRREGPSE